MFKTALTLTEDQLQRMVRYVRGRIEAIESARGGGWLAERERFEREWNDDFSHRQWESAVFARSNESLNMIGSGVDFIRARVLDEIFGSAPWFLADARSATATDMDLAARVGKHLRWKLGPEQIGFEAFSGDVITQACKLGECVAKIFYKTEEETYERIATVLWDEQTGTPVLTADGEPILRDESPVADAGREDAAPGATCWREQIVSERAVRYTGAKAVPLHFKEFYCPLNAPSIHEADFVAHMTSMRLSELCGHLGVTLDGAPVDSGAGPANPTPGDYVANALRRIQRESAAPKTGSGQPLPGEGRETPVSNADPEFRLLEAYFEFDARADGRPRRLFLMLAYDFDVPVFWDYIANVTPRGRFPFEAVAMNQEPHRWYGKSWFKKYEKFQRLIDKLLNQILYRNELAANPIKFRRKEAVLQWQDDQPFEIGPDKVFDLNDGYTADDALQTARIPELDEQTKFLLETAISNWRMRSGVSTASQGTFGSMPGERTATGIMQIVTAGSTLLKPLVMDAKRGLEAVLRQLVEYQYAYQDNDENVAYPEGEARETGTLPAAQVRDLEVAIELTLNRARQASSLEAARLAVDFFGKFLAVPDPFKPVAAPLFTTVYKSLEIDHADDFFAQAVRIVQQFATAEPAMPSTEESSTPGHADAETELTEELAAPVTETGAESVASPESPL